MSKSTRALLGLTIAAALAIPAATWAQAVPRGGGSTSSGSSGSSGSSSSGSSSGSSVESTPAPPPPPPPEPVRTPPPSRTAPDGSRVGTATPRNGSSNSGSSASGSAQPAGGVATGTSSATSSTSGGGGADPRTRDRNGRLPTGVAASRNSSLGSGGGFDALSYYYPWYSTNIGYVSYNPFIFGDTRWSWYRYGGFYNPYGYNGYGYYDPWYDPYYGMGYSNYGSSGSSYSSNRSEHDRDTTGSVRVKVKPANAKVYLDGTLMGTVEEFDGFTSHLAADAGPHRLEFKADGYEPVSTTVVVEPGKTITTRASLKTKK